jgi:cytochrome c-type biogenesis protein CcmF
MLSNFGTISIILLLTSCIVIFKLSFNDLKSKNIFISKNIYYTALFQTVFSIICFVTLVAGFVISDFSLITVFENSHSSKPLFYKIAGTWGNHEGSLLLWINILVIFSYLFLIYNRNNKKNFRLYTLIIQNFLILGFSFFLLVSSNPFSKIFPIPLEGLGLNPILQDPALAIHPPLLYVGFVGSSIYFSAAISSMLTEYKGKVFAQSIKPWVLISWSFQTLGIIIGSIWAYYELGWGGFWFWDPVENSSLMPWFVMTALMHSTILLEKRNIAYPWVIVLCLSTFILSVTGTFLVRSGVLNSVHTFASDPSRGLYILIFLSTMIFFSLFVFFKKVKKEKYIFIPNSKETFLLFNNWFMAFYLFTLFIGTVYPIFLEVITNTKISIGPPFYNTVIIPVLIPFLFLMAFGPKIKWIKHEFSSFYKSGLILLSAIIINIIIFLSFEKYSILTNIIIISSLFLIIHSITDMIKLLRKSTFDDTPRVISHLGFGLLIFFIGINHNYSIEQDFNLKVGSKETFNEYEIYFESLKSKEEKNYKAVVGNFIFSDLKKNTKEILKPEIRIYKQPETLTYEASIKTRVTSDIYLTMSNISRSDFYNIKFQKKPLMIWIWFSAILISLGGFMRLTKKIL